MPGKSQHRRGKHSARSRKGKIRQGLPGIVVQQQARSQKYESVSPVPTPSAKVLMPRSVLTSIRYPYIATELRRIAILAGIMLAVLVALYLIIS